MVLPWGWAGGWAAGRAVPGLPTSPTCATLRPAPRCLHCALVKYQKNLAKNTPLDIFVFVKPEQVRRVAARQPGVHEAGTVRELPAWACLNLHLALH